MTTTDLLALADQVEKLTGPSDAIDREIANALGVKWSTDDDGNFGGYNITPRHIRFTASLDAVRALGGMCVFASDIGADGLPLVQIVVDTSTSPVVEHTGIAATLTLAWLAACLRARASTDKGEA